ncbi:type 4a pilus biogenesis protein PilO [Planctomycetota bacterium]|nr:type 4a pilus biogenesis protein PilO [Planctomycetota bacterium]
MRFGTRELIFIVLLIAMPVASYMFVFKPRSERVEEARAEILKKQAKLNLLEEATRNTDSINDEIEKLTNAIDLFEQKLPAQQEVEVILSEVWNLADKHNLVQKSFRTEKIVGKAHYAEVPIKMVILGDFDGFYNFLIELEKLPRITQLPEVKLEKVENEDGQMKADLVLNIYFESNKKSAS